MLLCVFCSSGNSLIEHKTSLSLGQQAVSLKDTHDRVKALRRVTSTAQILLAYSMVMRVLAHTASRYVCPLCKFLDFGSEFYSVFIFLRSSSMGSQTSGLESLGLADIRILVRLMTLTAGGRAYTCVDRQLGSNGIAATERNSLTRLSFLSSAIRSVVSHSPAAYRQLVEICTQVSVL